MMQDPQAQLVQMYIEEFLREKNHTWDSVCHLADKAEAKRLMIEASTYAAIKAAEVGARANVIHELHGTVQM
ncbi:MAG: hypothetical protein HZC40_05825 [Chloroflexi bacterium]|nr:hypothetical protein [Chloroflexota bacterium]